MAAENKKTVNIENILTVDVEDWFHVCGVEDRIPQSSWSQLESRVRENTLTILDILGKKGVRATFFVLGYVAEQYPDLIKGIQSAGHEIGAHGYAHRRVYTMTPGAFREDLKRTAAIVSEITRCPIKGYRAPVWSIRDDSLWALDILQEEGFAYDSSMAPLSIIGNPDYRKVPHKLVLAKGSLWEFPPLVAATPVVNLPLGGGWGLRIFPYSLIRSAIRHLNNQGQPAVIFLHPREFDSAPPRIRLPLVMRFVLSAGIKTTRQRLACLLEEFRFTSVSNFLK